MILTDMKGRPFHKPRRADYSSDIEFVRAFHAHRDVVAAEANRSFDEAFRASMKETAK